MSEPKEVIRDYQIEDALMLEFSKTEREFFIEDKADFIAFDPAFADPALPALPYETVWQTAITAAENSPGENALLDQLTGLTNTVLAKMKLCRTNFRTASILLKKHSPKMLPYGMNSDTMIMMKPATASPNS